jgi:hypothetical protein
MTTVIVKWSTIIFTTFSSITFLLNFFLITHEVNTTLYFCNIMSLVIFTSMIIKYPDFIFDNYKDLFLGYLDKTIMNSLAIFVHLLPVYLFKDRQNLSELLVPKILFNSATLLLIYYIIFRSTFYKIYPASERELFYMSTAYFLFFIIISISR